MLKESRAVGLGLNEDGAIPQPASNREIQASASRKRMRELPSGTQSPAVYSSPSLDSSASGSARKKRRVREKLVGIASRAFPDQPPQFDETSSDEVLRSELVSGDYVFGDSSSRSANHVTSSQSKSNLPDRDVQSTSLDNTFKKSADDNIYITKDPKAALSLIMPQSDPPAPPEHGAPLLDKSRGQGPHSDDQRFLRKGSTVSSMSGSGSTGRVGEACRICNKSSALDKRTLVACSTCHRKYHRGCYQHEIPTDTRSWPCFKCERKSRNSAVTDTAIASSPLSVSKDGATRTGDILRSSSPTSRERQFKRPRSSLHNAEQAQSSANSAELSATPHNLSESQAQREIPETPNEQDASIIYGESQGQSQNRAQMVVSEPLSSGNQLAQDINGPIPEVQVQVQVNVHKQDSTDTTRQSQQAGLSANRTLHIPHFSYSNITPLFSTEPQTMDFNDDTAMEVDEPPVDQKCIEQVAAPLDRAVTMVHQSAQTDHLTHEPVKQQADDTKTNFEEDTAFTEACVPSIPTEDALARAILKELQGAGPELQSSWLTTDMLNDEAQQRLWRGAQVIGQLISKNSQNLKRDATSQTDHASSTDSSAQAIHNNKIYNVENLPYQQSSTTTQTDAAPNSQAPIHVVNNAVGTSSEEEISPINHVEAQDKGKVARDDYMQRLTNNIYELIRPNYAFSNLPKDDFYMKQKPAGPTLADIKARPTRKQMMIEPQSASRLGEHIFVQRLNNMMNGVRSDKNPERKLKTISQVPQQVLDELGGDAEGCGSLEELLELPRDVFPTDYKGDLVFANNSNRSARSRSNRNATKYWYGATAREHP